MHWKNRTPPVSLQNVERWEKFRISEFCTREDSFIKHVFDKFGSTFIRYEVLNIITGGANIKTHLRMSKQKYKDLFGCSQQCGFSFDQWYLITLNMFLENYRKHWYIFCWCWCFQSRNSKSILKSPVCVHQTSWSSGLSKFLKHSLSLSLSWYHVLSGRRWP